MHENQNPPEFGSLVQLSGRTKLTWPNNSQYFRSSRCHNWTSEHWYYGKIYGTPGKVIARAIKQLIAEGKIKRRWVEQDGENLPTEVSGRVNADSKEKQTMKPTIRRYLALVIAFLGCIWRYPTAGWRRITKIRMTKVLVHQVSDWCSGAAANFDWMREAKRENTRCGL